MVEEGLVRTASRWNRSTASTTGRCPLGKFATRVGPLMGPYDIFEIVGTGRGGTPRCPHLRRIRCCSPPTLVTALQTIVSRMTSIRRTPV